MWLDKNKTPVCFINFWLAQNFRDANFWLVIHSKHSILIGQFNCFQNWPPTASAVALFASLSLYPHRWRHLFLLLAPVAVAAAVIGCNARQNHPLTHAEIPSNHVICYIILGQRKPLSVGRRNRQLHDYFFTMKLYWFSKLNYVTDSSKWRNKAN